MSVEDPKLPAKVTSAPLAETSAKKRRGRLLMSSLACPRCHKLGTTYRIPEQLDMGPWKLDLPFFECSGCAMKWYDYTEMLAYILARNESDRMTRKPT